MSQKKTSFFSCTQCQYQSPKWIGCCSHCKTWGSMEEMKAEAESTSGSLFNKKKSTSFQTQKISTTYQFETIVTETKGRIKTGIGEWDRVMGGGLMTASFIVLTGEPGIGKSTLLLAVCQKLSEKNSILFISTEESLSQIKDRAVRLGCEFGTNAHFADNADLDEIIATTQNLNPTILIIDSIQNCYLTESSSIPGSIGQLKESTFRLMRLAKDYGITVIVTGHITKEGIIAGPKTMEHMVDAVFYLQAEDRFDTRILRSVKNRFGTINELGFFEMTGHGLTEVSNINHYLLHDFANIPGSSIVATIEGSRPLLLELQALVISSKLSMPQRVISGIDPKQVILIAAILEKYLHITLSAHDIFFKVGGGIKIKENGCDLAIALTLLSSFFQKELPAGFVAIGEISLTGYIRPINQATVLIKEAEKFGLNVIMIAHSQTIEHSKKITIKKIKHVYELLLLFE